LNRIIEEGDRTRFLSLLHTWFMNVGDFDVLRRILPQKASFYGETARFIAMMGLPEEKFLEFSRAAEAMRFELARQAFDQGKIHFAYYTISRAESYFRRALNLLEKIRFIPGGAGGSGAGSAGGAAGGAGGGKGGRSVARGGAEGGVPGRGAGGGVPGRSVAVGSVMGGEEGNGPGGVVRGGSVRGGGVLCGVEEETKGGLPRVASGEAFRGEGGGRPGEVERSVLEGDGGSVPGGDGEEMLRGVLVGVPERARNQEKIGPAIDRRAIDRREAVERGNVFRSPRSIGARFPVQEEEEREEAKEKMKRFRMGIGAGIGMGMEMAIGIGMGVEMGREMEWEMGREMGSYDQTSFQGEVDPQGVSGNSIKLTEFDALYRSTLLYLLRCRIEQGAEWAEIDKLVRRYLRTKPIPADVNTLEEYLVEKGFLASDLAKEMGDLPRLALQARLAFQANRYRQLMQLGRQLEKSFVVVPAEQRAAYGEVLRLVGDSFQKLDFVYDAERFYEKAVEVDPGNGEGLLRLRKNYLRLNELEKAREVEGRLDELILTGRIGPSGVRREKGVGSRSGAGRLMGSNRIIHLKGLRSSRGRGGGRGDWLEVAANKLGRWSLWLDGRPVELTLRAAGLPEAAMEQGGQEMGQVQGQPFALLSSPRLREGLVLARGVFAAVYWNKKLVWAGYLNDQKAEEVKFNLFSREGNNLLEIQALRRPLTFQLHLPIYEIK